MKNIILTTSFIVSLFAQHEIEGRWHLVGYEDLVMYQFVDTELFADAGYRYTIYSVDGVFGGLEDAGGSPSPYSIVDDIITIDLFFGNIVSYRVDYRCDGQVVDFVYIPEEIIHSTLFREGYNYIDDECEANLENCCEAVEIAENECGGLGCYIPQCTTSCEWESMQCWSSTGYCWCVDENGIEIEGSSTPSWQGLPDCEENLEECFDFTEVDFGDCEMILGVGLINGECSYISGCSWTIDGIDYSDLFFDSMNECEQSCDFDINCSDLNELACASSLTCDWIENIELGDCSDITNSSECYQTNQCSWYNAGPYGYWYDNCYGGTYEIDNSYCEEVTLQLGDTNNDGNVDVLDVVIIVSLVLVGEYEESGDLNGDGILNVLDIVQLVGIILN